MYLAPRSRKEQKVAARSDDFEAGGNFHMILLAMNLEGYRNLCKLVTASYTEGFYFKPRIDKELLTRAERRPDRHERLSLGRDQPRLPGRQLRAWPRDRDGLPAIFGDRYYLEVQDNHMPQSRSRATRC